MTSGGKESCVHVLVTVKRGCREIDSPHRGRRDSYESRLLLKFILEKEKKMANDNHLSLRSML